MSTKKENAAIVGVGVAACAACCAGPIVAVLAAIGVGTAAGYAALGLVAVLVGSMAVAFVLLRRRRRTVAGCVGASQPVTTLPVELGHIRSRA
jgi:hypothetical protein